MTIIWFLLLHVKKYFLRAKNSSFILNSMTFNTLSINCPYYGEFHSFWIGCLTNIHLYTQFNSVTLSCPTLCDPVNRSTPGLPVHHKLPEFTKTHVHRVGEAMQPSHPLLSPFPPAPNPSQHQGLFQWVNSLHEVVKVLEFQLQQHAKISPWTVVSTFPFPQHIKSFSGLCAPMFQDILLFKKKF